jgi:hypothetical protein
MASTTASLSPPPLSSSSSFQSRRFFRRNFSNTCYYFKRRGKQLRRKTFVFSHNETMQTSSALNLLRGPKKEEKMMKTRETKKTLRKQGVISVPSSSSNYNQQQSLKFLSPQLTEGLVIAIFCALGSSLSAFLLALVPTLRAAANAMNEVALLAEALKEEIPDTLAAVRVSGLELTDALEEVGELTSEVTGVTKRTTRAIDMSLTTAQRFGGMVYEGSKTMVPSAKRQVKNTVKPMVRRTANEIESIARERAAMDPYAGEIVNGVAATTKKGVGRARKVIEAAGVAKQVGQVYRAVKGKPPKVSD